MYVSGIELEGFGDRRGDAPSRGVVALLSDGARVCVALEWPGGGCPETMYRRLLSEAIRQVRRMPEFRRSAPPRFAPGVLPEGLAA